MLKIPPRLINLEGIDCSGKTTLAFMLAKDLSSIEKPFYAEHEPRFSSKEADRINLSAMDPWQREFQFMKDRMSHQTFLLNENVVLDRYILSGLAYAQTFSPEVVPMMTSVYFLPNEFKRPDVIVFIDIELEDALKFNELKKGTKDYSEKMTLNNLQTIRNNFKLHFQTMREWEVPVTIVKPVIGDLQATLKIIHEKVQLYI